MKGKVPARRLGPATRRALQLDALAAILPMDRRAESLLATTSRPQSIWREGKRRERPAGSRVGCRLFGDLGGRPH